MRNGGDSFGRYFSPLRGLPMPTIVSQLDRIFKTAIHDAFNLDADPQISPGQNEKFGDYQSNAAMGLVKAVAEKTGQKLNPRTLAEQIKSRLNTGDMASEISIAGPGFINIRLSPPWVAAQLQSLAGNARLGVEPIANPQTVVVDYSGPNVAKEMHVGHLRPTVIGDAIVRILEFQGQNVIRQNHIGDWGMQFGMLVARLQEMGADHAAKLTDLEEFYRSAKQRYDQDPAFAERSRQIVLRLQSGAAEERAVWQSLIEQSRRHFQSIYSRMNVSLTRQHERGESFYNPVLNDVVGELQSRNVAVESQGAIVVWVEGYEAPLIVRKTDGGFGYATTDLAAVRFRAQELHAQRIIYLTDARQAQHFTQFFAAARRAGWTQDVRLDHVTFGTILGPDGKPFKTKSGENVKLADLLDEAEERALTVVTQKNPGLSESQRRQIAHAVGIGAVKYFDLARDWIGNYVFDWDKMLSLDGNTAPYLQYAHARIRSIFRKASDARPGKIVLESPFELALAKHILRLGEIIELVARELKPHHLCAYLYDLATRFSGFYENCPVLQSDEPTRASRLALCDLTARTLEVGLDLLGIEHPDQM
jgi:arginyl-tRNA synthetase